MLQRKGPELVLVTNEPPTMRESVPQSPPRGQAQSNLQTPSLEKTLSLCEADSAPCGKEGDQNHSRRGMGARLQVRKQLHLPSRASWGGESEAQEGSLAPWAGPVQREEGAWRDPCTPSQVPGGPRTYLPPHRPRM